MPRNYNRWGWSRAPAPKAKEGSYRRHYGTSWWGKSFLAALEKMDYSGRLGRGKTYANKGLVEDLRETAPGRLTARVQGSRPRPYDVTIDWKPWSAAEAEAALEAVLAAPAVLGKLLAGEVPAALHELLTELGLRLFPENYEAFRTECSCPDWAVPCKHLAAVFYVLTGEIDNDPMRLLQLRGLDLPARLAEVLPAPEDGAPTAIRPLPLLRENEPDTASAPRWDEVIASELDFSRISDAGRRAVGLLADSPPFDAAGEIGKTLPRLYDNSAKAADKYFGSASDVPASDIVPTTGNPEIHLDADLHLSALYFFNEDDEILLERRGEAAVLDWFLTVEQLDRRYLVGGATRGLLLAFQLARKLTAAQAYVPHLVAVGDPDNPAFLVQYLPATLDRDIREVCSETYALFPFRLMFYEDELGEFYEFDAAHYAAQLVSALLGALIRSATQRLSAEAPAAELFLLRGRRTFDLVGTESYPLSIQRWLDRLYLAEQRWQPIFRVTEAEDGLYVDILLDDTQAPAIAASPLTFAEWLTERWGTDDSLTVFRTLGALADHFPELDDYLADEGRTPMIFSLQAFVPILQTVLPAMESLGLEVLLPAPLKKLLRPRLGLRVDGEWGGDLGSGIISLDGLLQFNWQAALGDQLIATDAFRKLLENANGLVRLKEHYAYLDPKEVGLLLEKLAEGAPQLSAHERLEALFTEEYEGAPVRIAPELRRQIYEWRDGPGPGLPSELRATLRPYQERGYAWMYNNARFGFGSIIADDMGLGKTLQVISLLLKYREEGLLSKDKALIVVPTSLLGNWLREIERFAPALRAYIYHGTQRELPDPEEYDVLLTTYGLIRSEEKTWKQGDWQVLVIDEAQQIKNPQAKQTKALKRIHAPVRIAMSGTPVENRLLDYWSLLDFTLPKFLGSRKYFQERFGRPIQQEHDRNAIQRFRKLTAPFVLRRLKTDKSIISDLPDKVVQTEVCRLTPAQAALYQSIIEENMRLVESADSDIGRSGLILKLITALKQCCNHPAQFLKKGSRDFRDSGKALLLRDRLDEILDQGEKVLIFTQYREMGYLLAEMIEDVFGIRPPFLHGGVPTRTRDEMIDTFQTSEFCPIFLISIKAGGTGLNLTAASHVIHYDLWWNPAVENQATDRAYRIGQDKTVFVHRLVTEKTFEERIDRLIQSKNKLADLSVGTGETWIGKMSNAELNELVRLT